MNNNLNISRFILKTLMQPMSSDDESDYDETSESSLEMKIFATSDESSDCEMEDEINEESDADAEPEQEVKQRTTQVINSKLDEIEFHENFHIDTEIFYELVARLKGSNYMPSNNKSISSEKALLIMLWYLTTSDTFRQLSEKFAISRSSAHTVLLRAMDFMLTLRGEYIKWPKDTTKIERDFQKIRGIKNVVGAIDLCHIKIAKPRDDEETYLNKNNFHSIIIQGVVDPQKLFLDIYCGLPGSYHETEVLQQSILCMKAKDTIVFGKKFLLADCAYPSLDWIVPPFQETGFLSEEQKSFNLRHSETHKVVKEAFNLLKTRFVRLNLLDHLHIDTSVKCIMVCCILHNICILNNVEPSVFVPNISEDVPSEPINDPGMPKKTRREELFEEMYSN